MVKPIPKSIIEDLQTAQEVYFSIRYPALELNPNIEQTLQDLLEFWKSEVKGLVPQATDKVHVSGMTNVGVALNYNEKIAKYKAIAEKQLAKVQKLVNKYLKRG